MILADTCILIDYIKENKNTINFINEIEKKSICINSIIKMEVLSGALNKKELKQIKIKLRHLKILPIDQEVLNIATDIIENFTLSHNAKIQYSIIAATALIYDIELFTYNTKDFKYIPNIRLIKLP